MASIEARRTYLEMTAAEQLVPFALPEGARLERVRGCPPSFYLYLYTRVGAGLHWVDRRSWTDEEVRRHLARPEIELQVLYVGGAPAGYVETERHADGSTEICYFGLLPECLGRGLGRSLLAEAVSRAWRAGARRVWLHTSSLDHAAALPNYLARGFQVSREESYTLEA